MSTYHQQTPFGGQSTYPQPVTSLCFDPASDILWTGNTAGLVNAYHGATRMRGVSYLVARGDPVKRITVSPEGVIHANASTCVGSWGRGGVNKWYYQLSLTSTGPAPYIGHMLTSITTERVLYEQPPHSSIIPPNPTLS